MEATDRALLSLDGLSVGDALGERFFGAPARALEKIDRRVLPQPPWAYTDDTEMALSVVDVLRTHGELDADALAHGFAARYDPRRGYGAGAHRLLQMMRAGADWRVEAPAMFRGQGSFGNGAAMRVAPIGAYFADDLDAVAEHAARSAITTHAHPDGVAGAIAVAVAAALAWRVGQGEALLGEAFIREVAEHVPDGAVANAVDTIAAVPADTPVDRVVTAFGSGQQVSALDTVPFALWRAAHHLADFVEAFWATVRGLGDRDTTCAMVGGIVSLSARTIPADWLSAREPLPI